MEQVFLKPAQLHIATTPTVISTVVGSCVAVTMFSSRARLAAMCHAILPVCMETDCRRGLCLQKGKYLTCVLEEMVQAFRDKKVPLADIETGVFGGARVLSSLYGMQLEQSVGWRNMRAGLNHLKEMGMKVAVRNVGGTVGRKIQFDTLTGRVVVKKHQGILAKKYAEENREAATAELLSGRKIGLPRMP